MSFTDTARNHKQLVRDAIAKAERELADQDKYERALVRPDGYPKYSPQETIERRAAIQTKRHEIIAARNEAISNSLEVGRESRAKSEAAMGRISALQENPIARLTAAEAANIQHLVALLEAGFGRSGRGDFVKQIRATATGTNRDQQIAALEVVQRRIGAARGDELAEYRAIEGELLKQLRDPGLARERAELVVDLQEADELIADVNGQARPLLVAAEQARMVASGNYADHAAGPPVVRNIGEAPVYEMVEQA